MRRLKANRSDCRARICWSVCKIKQTYKESIWSNIVKMGWSLFFKRLSLSGVGSWQMYFPLPILIGLFTFTSIQYFSRPSTVKCQKKSTQTMDEYQRPERLEPLKTLHETRANDQYSKLINSTEVYKLT